MTTTVTTPFVLAFDDEAATELAMTGGKGASLTRLTRAGLPVPGGFHVTTAAYDRAVAGDLRAGILAAMAEVRADAPETHEAAAERIAALFEGREPPAQVAEAVRAAYAALGDGTGDGTAAVAVRSSATAEDLPGMSFAGQQDTYLNISGETELLRAVVRCWASLWTARAIGYRARHAIPPEDVALAVVVQQLVPADAAGIMFTADPMTGAADRISINAAWGLGEAVVGGQVTPDTFAVGRGGGRLERNIADKTVRTVRTAGGTRDEPVPEADRSRPSITDGQAEELAALGERIEELYGTPMDVEWAVLGGRPYILQARPITGLPAAAGTEEWNDSTSGDFLWTNANLGEAIPSVMTPMTWSLVEIFMTHAFATGDVGYPAYGNIGGRFYMNLSLTETVGRVIGSKTIQGILDEANQQVFGWTRGEEDVPLLPLTRWQLLRKIVPFAFKMRPKLTANIKKLPAFMATAEERGTGLRVAASEAPDGAALARLWRAELKPYLIEASEMLQAAGKQDGNALVLLRRDLRRMVGEADTNALTTGLDGDGGELASLETLFGLAALARGEIDRETYVRRYGHRCADEFEVSVPRPAEDPAWLDRQLAAAAEARPVDELLAGRRPEREAAWKRLEERFPDKTEKIRKRLGSYVRSARGREDTRSEVIRAFWALRCFVVRAGEVTGHGDDVFFLTIDELIALLDGNESALGRVQVRRATYELYRSLPSYPAVIRGRFDPVRWAADPGRRGDVYNERGEQAPVGDAVRGFPGAVGVVEGIARVVGTVEEGEALRPGEILVTTVTNVGWTPLFPRAAAVVTDVGAPLSHAAIVARELGIPAVVGCGNAMMRLHTGDHLRVDGEKGTVEILTPASG